MTQVVLRENGARVSLTQQNFIQEGGEGKVYAVGQLAVKVYSDPDNKMIPEGKIRELAEMETESILAPRDVVLEADRPVGYTMRLARGCMPLMQAYARPWREEHGYTPESAMRVVLSLRENYEHVHKHGGLVVDGNDQNSLLRQDFSGTVAIDTDSYQTASYPPTAIAAFVKDPTTDLFTEGSDWFSFAIVAFSIMVGIHPFKGSHPDYAPSQLLQRMADGASALVPGVGIVATAMPFDVIPPLWRAWFEGVFHDKDRSAPPMSTTVAVVVVPEIARRPGDKIELVQIWSVDGICKQLVRSRTHVALLADGSVASQGGEDFLVSANGRIGVTPGRSLIVAHEERGWWAGVDANATEDVFRIEADACSVTDDGRFHFLRGEDVMEVSYREGAGRIRGLPVKIGAVAPEATRLFSGVAIQTLLKAAYASILLMGGSVQVRLAEIEGKRLIDARFVGGRGRPGRTGVLSVVTEYRGRIDVHMWHGLVASEFSVYAVEEDVDAYDLNFVELDTGVCVSADPDGALKMFKPGKDECREVKDGAMRGARLFADGGSLIAALPDGLYKATLKESS